MRRTRFAAPVRRGGTSAVRAASVVAGLSVALMAATWPGGQGRDRSALAGGAGNSERAVCACEAEMALRDAGLPGTLRGLAPIAGAVPYDPTPVPYLLRPPSNPAMNQERDLLPETRRGLHAALDGTGIRWFVAQGINDDGLSAGTHLADGRRGGSCYSAVADISIAGLTTSTPRHRCTPGKGARCLTAASQGPFITALSALRSAGFAAWYRHFYDGSRGVWENEIHTIDPISPYHKASLRDQMDDYLRGRDGLAARTTRDAAGTVRPNRRAFCRRSDRSASVKGCVPVGGSARYRSGTRSRYCGR